MHNFISDSRFIQPAMFRMCFGLIFVGMAIAAHTAQSEEVSVARDLKVLTIRQAYSGADWLFPYQINTDMVLAHAENTTHVGSKFSHTLRLGIVAEPKKETVWATNARWQIATDSDRVLLSPLLRFESQEGQLEIKPRRHSIWAVWRKAIHF